MACSPFFPVPSGSPSPTWLALGLGLLLNSGNAWARDVFLTIGGGFSPASNQISLESNVRFFQRFLTENGVQPDRYHVFFADGTADRRDLQMRPAQDPVPPAHRLMARLFGSERHLGLQFRNHEIPADHREATRAELEAWFDTSAKYLRPGDRLILYATAHGTRSADRKSPWDTRLYLWNNQTVSVKEMARFLEKLPPRVDVVCVMVQCFSGGFANLIHAGGDPSNALSHRRISGFFATVPDRQAAGCTADIEEDNYDEYSSHFWAALRGRDRLDRPVTSADLNGDGRVSFEEAHAYTLLTSNTIDIPVKTSGNYLRSVLAENGDEGKGDASATGAEDDYPILLDQARPVDRAVLEGLSRQLNLASRRRGRDVRQEIEALDQRMKKIDRDLRSIKRDVGRDRNALRDALRARWPELFNAYNPDAIRLLMEEGAVFIQAVESHPRFATWEEASRRAESLEQEKFLVEKRWARHRRFLRILENVMFEGRLEREGTSLERERYQRLLDAEGEGFPEAGSRPE